MQGWHYKSQFWCNYKPKQIHLLFVHDLRSKNWRIKKSVNLNSMAFGKYGNIYHHKIPFSFGFVQEYFSIVGWWKLKLCFKKHFEVCIKFGTPFLIEKKFKSSLFWYVMQHCLLVTDVVGPTACPEMSASKYQSMLHHIPEEQISHLHHVRSLKSHRKL